ncbi:Lrp/AsnC family transcriptional regulator [Cellulomonas fimi]|uniref:Lrp/AsnC family transcriptional regulator n=1 Tax=Cellulomonas fimi TaxID=1708 RepID=A0A7Y0M2P8_CELFI|nr:Lrp/AsnC family transcriptional regulator [Cellulomonas fimi]NMR21397.1 Lrp/AsnC family transcriptional regulator [Cellulomonas fimi]
MRRLDGTDVRLLLALVADPRGTVVAFAQALGLSRNTVQARMTALESRGALLPFDRRIDPVALGYQLTAFITVHVHQPRLPAIVQGLAQIPEVVEAYGLSGPSDLLLRVVARDAEDLFRINGAVLAVAGVERAETSLAMGEVIPYRMVPLLEASGRAHPATAHETLG